MNTSTDAITLDTARMTVLNADPLRVLVYEGRSGALSFTELPGFDGEYIVEYARYIAADQYFAAWNYVGTVPHGDSARVLADFYLNV